MRHQGSAVIIVIMAVAFLAVSLTVLMFDWAWVDIQAIESSQKIHLKMPIPINLISFALNFAPREEMQIEVPKEVWEKKELIMEALKAIQDCPDTTFLQISTPEAEVLVKKEEGRIIFELDAEDAKVQGALPIEPMISTLEKWDWKYFEPKLALDIFSAGDSKSYIFVDSEEAKVKITS